VFSSARLASGRDFLHDTTALGGICADDRIPVIATAQYWLIRASFDRRPIEPLPVVGRSVGSLETPKSGHGTERQVQQKVNRLAKGTTLANQSLAHTAPKAESRTGG